MENVESQMMNPLKDLTFGGYLFEIIWNLRIQQTVSMPVQITVLGTSTLQRLSERTILHRSAHRPDGNGRSMGTRLKNYFAKRLPHKERYHQKIVSQDKKQTRAWWNSFWQRSFIEAIGEAENKDGNDVEEITRNYTLFRYMLGCNAYGGATKVQRWIIHLRSLPYRR